MLNKFTIMMKKFFLLFTAVLMTAGVMSAQDLNKAIEAANTGNDAFQLGDYALALEQFQNSLTIAEGLGEEGAEHAETCKSAICNLHMAIAKNHYNDKNFTAAIDAFNKAKEVAASVAGAVKGFFGIRSPSRLFMEFGEFNMMGLANGMQNQAANTANVAQSAVSSSLPSVSPQQLSTGLSSRSSGATLSLTQNITVSGAGTQEQAKDLASQSMQFFEREYNAMMNKRQRVAY